MPKLFSVADHQGERPPFSTSESILRATRQIELAAAALDTWLKAVTVGLTDAKVVQCLDATQKFYEAIGYDWDKKLDELDALYETVAGSCIDTNEVLSEENMQ